MAASQIRLVAFDLAGTTIDFGSRAPAGVFVELFARHGVTVSEAEARGPMGTAKRDHIAALAALPRVAEAWRKAHAGRSAGTAEIDELYAEFIPLQLKSLPAFGDLIPGTVEAAQALRAAGMRVAVTTGYDTAMTKVVLEAAGRQGFVPDAAICASDVAAGRPAPWRARPAPQWRPGQDCPPETPHRRHSGWHRSPTPAPSPVKS